MNGKPYTSSHGITCWKEINFSTAGYCVKKLQRRIQAACYQGDITKLEILIHLTLHSFYARALAVKHVCSRPGGKTPGVDGVLWLSDQDKFDAIHHLRLRGYRPKPVKRVYIKKSSGGRRALGIPTLQDRAIQTLYKFALEPIAEFLADEHSYAYRPGRNVNGAIAQVRKYMSEHPEYSWVLKADIQSCFENISQDWLLEHIPMDKKFMWKFLRAGYVAHKKWYPTDTGLSQGGSLSNVLCNLTLDGLEDVLAVHVASDVGVVVRYADDFLILTNDKFALVQEVVPAVEKFLSERGLNLSEEKTKYLSLDTGVTFLGWRLYRQDGRIISIPSEKAVQSLREKVEKIVLYKKFPSLEEQKKKLKFTIRGWNRFYQSATFPFMMNLKYEIILLVKRLSGNRDLAVVASEAFLQK